MGKLNVDGEVDILIKDIGGNLGNEDYSKWDEDCLLSKTLVSDLDETKIIKLDSEIANQMSANIYYLTMRTKGNYSVFIRDTRFGAVYDIVDLITMKGEKRYYYVRLDLVTGLLIKKYPNDIVSISKLLQKGDFEINNDSEFKIGGYTV